MSRSKKLSNKVLINGQPVYFRDNADAKEARENSGGGEDVVFDETFTTTDTVGGMSSGSEILAGTTLKDMMLTMLVSYQGPVMGISGWSADSNREHGYSFSDTDFTLTFTNASNVDDTVQGQAAFTDSYIANGTDLQFFPETDGSQSVSFSRSGELLVTDAAVAGASSTAVSRNNAAKLTVSGFVNTDGSAISSSTASSTVKFRYWVVDNPTRVDFGSLNDTNGTALITDVSSLAGSGAGTIESNLLTSASAMGFNGKTISDYVYWVYPSCVNVNQILNPSGTPLYNGDKTGATDTAVVYIGEFTLSNQHNKDVYMTVLRSKNPSAIGTGNYTLS